jgi:uncharacterized protein (TIGR03382 family)
MLVGVGLAACQDTGPSESVTEQLAVVLSPSSVSFGTYAVGASSPFSPIDVNPALGDNYDTINSITASCPDFTISAPGLPADVYRTCIYDPCRTTVCTAYVYQCTTDQYVTYQFQAKFTPTVAGTVSCVVSIVLADGTVHKVTLSGTGMLPPIDIDVQPKTIPFGDVRRNTTSTAVGVTVKNAGGQTLTVNSVSASAGFTIASGQQTSYTLAAGASMPYAVTCNPTSTGGLSGSFVVTSNDPSTPTVTIPLSCNGIDSNLSMTPSPTTLATTRVGEPVQAAITLANSGTASMQLESISVTGDDLQMMGTPPSPGAYPTGTIGTVNVGFGAAAKGTVSGTLTVTYDGGQVRSIPISARALGTSMALNPDGDVNFGPVCAGQTRQETFTLLANDEAPFQVSQLGGVTEPFSVTTPTLPASVSGGGGSQLTFTVTAAPVTTGVQSSSLSLVTDIPGAPARSINMTVDALDAGVSPSPSTLDFGSTPENTTTLGQPVHLSNCSASAISYMNARIEGVDAAEFAIVAAPTGATIPPTGLASWLVVLSTNSVGLKHAEFVVDYDGGTARVPLAGEGLGELPTTPGTGEELSYYGCATTGSAGGAPLVLLALGLVRRRRRRR